MRRLLFALLLAAPVPGEAQELAPRDIAQRARPALVSITARRAGSVLGTGSGFVVSPDGRIVTSRHVIEGATSLTIQLADGDVYDRVLVENDDLRRDLVVLRIPASGLPSLPFGNDRAARAGDRVYVLGNPRGLEGSFSDGLVSAVRTVDGTTLLQITAPISPGSSGGPVMNGSGQVIGVATLYLEGGQNLNMAVAGRYVTGLLALGGTPRPFEEVAARFAATASSAGSRSEAVSDDDEEYPEWVMVLAAESMDVTEAIEAEGFSEIFEPEYDALEAGYYHEIDYDFSRVGQSLVIAAVCDADCSRLELDVFNSSGRREDLDARGRPDRPQIRGVVTSADRFTVRVTMRRCSSAPCYYALQVFAK